MVSGWSANARAAVSVVPNCRALMAGSPIIATRAISGNTSLSSSICFPLISGKSRNTPVMFPPGWARVSTNPIAMGSLSKSIATIGTLLVAFLTAANACGPLAKITSTLSRTKSAASSGSSSDLLRGYRPSITNSVGLNCPIPLLNASRSWEGMRPTPRVPTWDFFDDCCARAAPTAQSSIVPLRSAMNSRRLIRLPRRRPTAHGALYPNYPAQDIALRTGFMPGAKVISSRADGAGSQSIMNFEARTRNA